MRSSKANGRRSSSCATSRPRRRWRPSCANPVALAHLGLKSLDELAHVDPWAPVPPERRQAVLAYVERLRSGEAVSPLQHRLTTPEGREIILESSLSLTTFGGAPGLISSTRDITERMRLQAELMQQDRLASLGVLAAGVAKGPASGSGLGGRWSPSTTAISP